MNSYRVVVTHEQGWWLADVPELAGTHTAVESRDELEPAVREAIALALDLPEGPEAEQSFALLWDGEYLNRPAKKSAIDAEVARVKENFGDALKRLGDGA